VSTSTWQHYRARLAITRRHHPDADTTDLERALRAARAEEYVRRLLNGCPALTLQQRAELAAQLLTPAGDAS
jgi:hypothetical protein